MESRARARLKRKESNQRAFFVEQTATTLSCIERRRRANHVAAVVSIQPIDNAIACREIVSGWIPDGDHPFPDAQRFGSADWNSGQVQPGDADQTEVVYQTAGFNRSAALFTAMNDFDHLCVAHHVARGGNNIGRDDHTRAETSGTVGRGDSDLDQALPEVACLRRTYWYGCRGSNPKQRGKKSRQMMSKSHEMATAGCAPDHSLHAFVGQSLGKSLLDNNYRPRLALLVGAVTGFERAGRCTTRGRSCGAGTAPVPRPFAGMPSRARATAVRPGTIMVRRRSRCLA